MSAAEPPQGRVLGSGSRIATPLAPPIFHSGFASQLPEVREEEFLREEQMAVQSPGRGGGREGAQTKNQAGMLSPVPPHPPPQFLGPPVVWGEQELEREGQRCLCGPGWDTCSWSGRSSE